MFKRTAPWLIGLVALVALGLIVPTTLAQTLAPGARGVAVAGLQRGLQALGYDPGTLDGIFGRRTETAVQAFQGDAGLSTDGIAGPLTLGALDRFLALNRALHYTVQPGDSLYLIARRFHTTAAAISELNRLKGDALGAGQGLLIPVAVRSQSPVARPDRPLVMAYYVGDTAAAGRSLERAGDSLDAVAAFAYRLSGDGTLAGDPFPELMQWAAARDKPVLALVHNAGDYGFMGADAAALLIDPAAQDRAVAAIYAEMVAGQYAGVQLDLENVPAALRDDYTAFVRRLAHRLHPAGLLVTVAVPARTGDLEAWFDAYDYTALGQVCDFVSVMAYDQHSGDGLAGPIASVEWEQAVAEYAAKRIPAGRLLVGMAAYGYDWTAGLPGAQALSAARVPALAAAHGVAIAWDDAAQVPWFSYLDGAVPHVIYYENAYSLAPKLDAARRAGAAGMTLWRLGLEDPEIWNTLAAARSTATGTAHNLGPAGTSAGTGARGPAPQIKGGARSPALQ